MPRRSRPVVICPSDHAHAASTRCRSRHGCTCTECRARAAASQRASYRAGASSTPLLVDSLGAHRRIQALRRMGWSASAIAVHAGRSESWVGAILRERKITRASYELIERIFNQLHMKSPQPTTRTERSAIERTRGHAAREGWAPPLAWDNIDDPSERPKGLA